MQLKYVSLALGILAVIAAAVGWLRPSAGSSEPEQVSPRDSVVALVRRLGPPAPTARRGDVLDARSAFLRRHQGELEQTFDVADVAVGDSIALGLVRYSIGRSVYHDVRWLRRVGGAWFLAQPPAASSSDSTTGPDSLAALAERWLGEGESRWW